MDSTKVILCGDELFGPVVESACRGGFDFTVQFEELVLAILPTAIFLLLSPLRAVALLRRRITARRNSLYVAKLVTIGIYVGLQLALLVQWAQTALGSSISIASTTLSLASGLSLALLSHLEHAKSVRPSFVITFYLVFTVLLDVARVRTQWLLKDADGVAATLTASLTVKVVLLTLEAIEKRRLLLGSDREYPPESTSGPFSRGFFLWLNSLLVSGFGKVLSLADLPPISEKLESKTLAKDLSGKWDKCNQKKRHALALATVLTFRWEFFLIAFPKLAYVALSLSHPFLIQEAVSFVQNAGIGDDNNVGYGLIGGFAFVYVGLAVIDTIPAFIQLAGTLLSGQIADKVSKTQKAWLEAIQTRINFTSEILGSMKNVKMLGLTGQMFNMIQALRDDEIAKSKKFRQVQAYNTSIVNVPEIVARLLLFGAYAIVAHINGTDILSVSQAISSLALIFLVSKPLSDILVAIPQGWSALGCFQRIQTFLNDALDEDHHEQQPEGESGTELHSIRPEVQRSDITLENVSFVWSRSSHNLVSEVTVRINPSETGLTILTGPVGCDIDINRLSHGDLTVVGSKGVNLSGGQKQRISIARAVYSRKSIAILDDVLSGLDVVTEEAVFRGVFGSNGLFKKIGTTVILATHSVKRLPEADLILAMNGSGKIVEQGKFADLNVPGRYVHSLKIDIQSATEVDDIQAIKEDSTESKDIPTETQGKDSSRQTGDWATYKYYATVLGRSKLLVFVAFVTLNEAANGLQSVWLNWWAQSNERGDPSRLGYWLGIFAAFSVAEAVGLVSSIASILKSALNAPMLFLAQTETGVLVNSQDLRLADMTLPSAITNIAFQLGQCIVATVLAATAVGYFATVLPLVIFVLYLIQRFYLRTSRQLRLLELETSAPLFSHFIESLSGLVTIRAFGWTEEYTNKTNRLLDQSQKPFYLLLCIQRWLVLVLDLVVAGLAVLLVGLAVALRSRINPGLLGIALVQLPSLSHALTALVQFWTLLETSLGAIARIKDFSDTTPEEAIAQESSEPPSNWPSHGAVTFESVSACYEDDGPLILRDVSFSLKGGQKIGIVGRTGSGKSSTVQAILRMINLKQGRILVDNVDLATITSAVVREHVTTLTQDPFLFPASIRSNIDPLGVFTDEVISVALKKVKLWNILQDRARGDNPNIKAVLDTSMNGDLLSHGQRQLFCLARALLKPGKILILDEPTSSVDSNTDAQMQAIVRHEFRDHTIIMIAHRLSSLLDFDLILVLDQGLDPGPSQAVRL
ncbi:hypothetical protein CHU98_g529 [Xylaria longipes]|nr:hypothetical protein CHU98_g529 [Xylaria longipes]